MRRRFSNLLLGEMGKNEKIHLVVGDLGYGMWNTLKDTCPNRFHNPMAAELTGIGMCIGMTYNNIIPIFYSITNFAIFRPFEILRNYVNYESAPIKIVCSGRNEDYKNQGISHKSKDAKYILDGLPNIKQYWPETKEDITGEYLKEFLYNGKPCFLSLRRQL